MRKANINFKTIAIMAIVLFVVSIICSVYITSAFLGFTGCALGWLLGAYHKEKKRVEISKKTVVCIIMTVFLTLAVTLMCYLLFKEKSLCYVILFNIASMVFCLYYITKNTKKNGA